MVSEPTVTITVYRANKQEPVTIEALRGGSLRKVLLDAGLTPYQGNKKVFNCHGLGICGTCKVLLLENAEWWDRRSCQIQCFQNLEIQLK